MKLVELTQGTSEWHEWRAGGIGGSEAPAMFEESPYFTYRDLYFIKRGVIIPEEDPSKEYIFQRGHEAEAKMRGEIFAVLGHTFEPICVEHPTLSFIRASLDGYSDVFGILEAKLIGKEALANALNGEIPRAHWIQMQHQMIASGVDQGKWFGSTMKDEGAIVDVAFDKPFAKLLQEKEEQFWESVQKGIVPPLSDRDTFVPEDVHDVRLFQDLASYKKQADEAQAKYDQILESLKAKYTHPKVECYGVKMLKVSRQGSISYAKIPELKKLDPQYLETFRGAPSSYVKVSFKETV